jgi:hypothetical protein
LSSHIPSTIDSERFSPAYDRYQRVGLNDAYPKKSYALTDLAGNVGAAIIYPKAFITTVTPLQGEGVLVGIKGSMTPVKP